jgi:molecular chaperone GrpE
MTDSENHDDTNPTSEADDAAAQVLDDLDKLRAERDQFQELMLRTRADFENYQKRSQRDLQEERRYALRPLVADLLPAIDNLDRALAAVKEPSPLSQGVAMVKTQLLEALKRHGITRIEPMGQPFDPHQHEAVMQQPAANKPPGTVLQVLEPGYLYHDRVLRPSKVIVSKSE